MKPSVIVTGASKGIGAATAKLLGNKHCRVVVNYHSDETAANAVVSQILKNGGQAASVKANISSETDVKKLFDFAQREYGEITGLVNNAGILRTQSRLIDISVDRFKRILETNTIGTFLCCREAVKRMPHHQGASIVNVSSIASQTGSPKEYIDYAASKGAVDSLTVGLAKEVSSLGIRVNAVRPGMIKTEIHALGGEPDRVDRLASMIPMGRGGEAEEVAQAIDWLLSNDSSYCTGTFIDVAGGLR